MPTKKIRGWLNAPWLPPPHPVISPVIPIYHYKDAAVPISEAEDFPPLAGQPLRYRVFGSTDEFVAWQLEMQDKTGTDVDIIQMFPVSGDFAAPDAENRDDDRLMFGLYLIYRERSSAL
jgi:hypothetical protein